MKVKLLKKVRKKFVINRIDELASDDVNGVRFAEKELGVPFYQVKFVEEYTLHSTTHYVKTYPEAQTKLLEMILDVYSEEFRHKERKTEKVWYKS